MTGARIAYVASHNAYGKPRRRRSGGVSAARWSDGIAARRIVRPSAIVQVPGAARVFGESIVEGLLYFTCCSGPQEFLEVASEMFRHHATDRFGRTGFSIAR